MRSRFIAAAGACLMVASFTLAGLAGADPAAAASSAATTSSTATASSATASLTAAASPATAGANPSAAGANPTAAGRIGKAGAAAAAKPSPARPRTLPSGATQDCPPPASRLQAQCESIRLPHVKKAARGRVPTAVSAAAATPLIAADLQSAYGITGTVSSAGGGETVAIVDAYGDPAIDGDLTDYRNANSLSTCDEANGCLHVYNETGGTSLPAAPTGNEAGWQGETALDVEMVSAVCPNCHIDLFEATSPSFGDLITALNTAAGKDKFVSNSWGGGDFPGEAADDAYLDHPGVAITVASGDNGYGANGFEASYPASSQFVTSVGGTQVSGAPGAWTESVWNDATGAAGTGCSSGEPKPSWQADAGCANRTENDVAGIADGPGGIDVYSQGAEEQLAGTSAAAPAIAAMYALAGTPAANTYPASYLYSDPSGLSHVASGSDGTCEPARLYLCNAADSLAGGYNGPTGLGIPNGNLTPFTGPTGNALSAFDHAAPLVLQAGKSFAAFPALSVVDTDPGQPMNLTVTGFPAGLSINWTYGADGMDVGTISGAPSAAGSYTATLAAKDNTTGATTAVSFPVTVTGSMTASYTAGTGAVKLALGGKCLDDANDSSANGNKVQIWQCLSNDNGQVWSYQPDTYAGDPGYGGQYAGTVRINGKCLDVAGAGQANGTKVDLYACNGGANQEWAISGVDGQLYNPVSNKCLDDPGSSTANGKQLDIWACTAGSNQNWQMPASPVDSAIAGLCLADNGGSSANGTRMISWTCNGAAYEKWAAASDGSIRIYGKCLDAAGQNTENGAVADLYACNGGLNQDWEITAYGQIENVNAEKCLSIPSNSATKGTGLTLQDCEGEPGQLWAFS